MTRALALNDHWPARGWTSKVTTHADESVVDDIRGEQCADAAIDVQEH
jgi:hypothetical protein